VGFSTSIIFSILCGVLLFSGFPKIGLPGLCWIAIALLISALKGRTALAGFLIGLVSGAVFFLGIFRWILEVSGYTYLHHTLLAIYLGSYIGCFGLIYTMASRRIGTTAGLAAAPFIWVSTEYLRSNAIFLELPWGLLAHSQYTEPLMIQISSVFGPWGLSFLIVSVNAGIAGVLLVSGGWTKKKKEGPHSFWIQTKRPLWVTGLSLLLLLGTIAYGHLNTNRILEGASIHLAVVQGNIEQMKKWDPAYARFIMQTYHDLTVETGKDRPELIIWPETATPASVSRYPQLMQEIKALASKTGSRILFGSAQGQKFGSRQAGGTKFHNSAFLVVPNMGNEMPERYDKIRLFPFGEYLPYKDFIPWSWIGVAEFGSYIPGTDYKLFEVDGVRFAATICWENLFPDQVRQFVKRGARFIVNITNEAWFGETAAPEQFLSMNVFRAVENGVYVVRCANTGISCFIDPCGRVVDKVKNDEGKNVFVSGFLTGEVVSLSSNTFYTRYGDWFPWLCIIVSVGFILAAIFSKTRKEHEQL
jgi:apolipoprotein N-acyltransferase